MKTFDKIMLATQQIQNMASRIENTRQMVSCVIRQENEPYLYQSMVTDNETTLQESLSKMMVVIEDLAGWINSNDNLCGEDIALYKVPFDVLYNRVSEDEFEDIEVIYKED